MVLTWRRAASCALCLLAAEGRAAGQTYWENGNFLRPTPKAGSFLVMDVGDRFGAWRVVGASGSVAWVSGTYTRNGYSFPAQGTPSNSWVNLAAISQSATGIMHYGVATTVGQSYTLSFYVGNMYDPGGIYGVASTVAAYENSTLLGTYTNASKASPKTETWQQFSVSFLADAPYTTIAFINGDPPGDLDCGVDNVVFGPTGGTP